MCSHLLGGQPGEEDRRALLLTSHEGRVQGLLRQERGAATRPGWVKTSMCFDKQQCVYLNSNVFI